MKESEKVTIWNADGGRSGAVVKEKYEVVRDFIVSFLKEHGEVSFQVLLEEAKKFLATLAIPAEESGFLVIKVKGDLEARKILRKRWLVGRQQIIKLRRSQPE